MKYFGEYLVEKKIISAEKLVQAVIQQNQNQPLAAQIAYDNKILSAEEIIKVFSFQQEHKLDFYSAGQATGILSPDKRLQIEAVLTQHRSPLASVLIKTGTLATKDMVHALDEFLSTAKMPSGTTVASPIATPPAQTAPSPQPGSSTSVNSNLPQFTFEKIDAIFGNELQASLAPSKLQEITNVLQLVKQNAAVKELVQEFLQDVLRSVHTVRGLSKAAKACVIDHVCSLMDAAIVKELRSEQPNTDFIITKLTPGLEQALGFCAELKAAISNTGSEETFWNNATNQANYTAFTAKFGNN